MTKAYEYQNGWGGYWQSEAIPGALVEGQNSPQKAPLGLYAEQLSGSAFTRPRHLNLRSWLYRILPSVAHTAFKQVPHAGIEIPNDLPGLPMQMRWDPLPEPKTDAHFVQGLTTLLYNGSPDQQRGAAVHLYSINKSMVNEYFYNADGDLLIVPYQGQLEFFTEFGKFSLAPGEILIVPRGVKFQVTCLSKTAKGYVLENYGLPFLLPDLGPIGSNGLANPKDFLIPQAHYETKSGELTLFCKFHNQLWQANMAHSPLNVVAWHGNYAPYKYDLRLFNTINTVSYDHCDPSIFTVLTSPSASAGIANVDFVIFPQRWMVAEHTFRPPYFHRNIMSEYMGLIHGTYDAKAEGFQPGGGSLHNCMSAHGPDAATTQAAFNAELKPEKMEDSLAFMFETALPWIPTRFALSNQLLQENYQDCWQEMPVLFKTPA